MIDYENPEKDAYVIPHFNRSMALSGIKYTTAVTNDVLDTNTIQEYEVYINKDNENWILAKKGPFHLSSSTDTETVYFDKEGTIGGNPAFNIVLIADAIDAPKRYNGEVPFFVELDRMENI